MDQLNLLATETAEMVPDEFLTWLMSDLEDGKDVSNLGPSSSSSQQQQQQQQQPPPPLPTQPISVGNSCQQGQQPSSYFNMFEGVSGINSCSGNGGINSGPSAGKMPANFLNEYSHGRTYSLSEEFPRSVQNAANSTNIKHQKEKEGNNDDDESDKERDADSKVGEKRKAPRSREIAKECRRRQRERKEELEKRVATLKKENQELREHYQNVSQRTTDIQRQRANMEQVMKGRLQEIEKLPEDSDERKHLVGLVLKFTDLYADYGSCRQKEIAFHLAQLEKLILPTQITKMILWTLQQDYKFFEEKSSPIWGILVKELDMTPDQISFLTKQRSQVMELLLQLKESLSLIKQLKVSIKDKHETFDRECGKITKESSANQTVRFILWITNNADKLAKVIPDFERIVPHVSHAPDVAMPP